jgi:hypothetical protein
MDNLFGFKLMIRQPQAVSAEPAFVEPTGLHSTVSAKFGFNTEPVPSFTMGSAVSAKLGAEPTPGLELR